MSLQITTDTLKSVNQVTRFRKMGEHRAFTDNGLLMVQHEGISDGIIDAPEVLGVKDAHARKPMGCLQQCSSVVSGSLAYRLDAQDAEVLYVQYIPQPKGGWKTQMGCTGNLHA